MRSLVFGLAALATVCASNAPARAGFIVTVSDQVTANPGGYIYEYTLTVDALSDLSATDFALDIAPGADLTNISIPTGWSVAYTSGDSLIYWFAPLDGSFDVSPGSSATFSFTSAFGPESKAYSSFGYNSGTGDFAFADGVVASPGSVPGVQPTPGPTALVMLASGLPVFLGWGWARRRAVQLDQSHSR
ncbi:hypothetical protein J8F10_05570 [Gemmata sp. G18]|uniref:PEP-CTERM sorting domain-containing protein n=1 Tax=Gemmata palustris TaxID=2822762 RepID=A0ABS5BM25_9BACT|nr:hypothetical protein [Gemmata palustris]MBP3954752.1 hypothetical protein [Gemmata palustris]